jgi:hypothetical protein
MRTKLLALGLALAIAGPAVAGGRNLKYYPQDISGDDLQANMKLIKNSLGVRCDHCHVVMPNKEFFKDTPRKETARNMLRMVDKISKEYFTWDADAPKATCFMCHHGAEKPELKPEKADAEDKFKKGCEDPKNAKAVKLMKDLVEKINKKLFTWKDAPKATCWMCHRGEKEPKLKAGDE